MRAAAVRRGKTERITPRALSRMDWSRLSPWDLRSSVVRATPCRTACRGEVAVYGLPSSAMDPRVKGWTPKTASTSSVRPEPCSPATPTISPARSVRSMPSSWSLPPPSILRSSRPTPVPGTASGK